MFASIIQEWLVLMVHVYGRESFLSLCWQLPVTMIFETENLKLKATTVKLANTTNEIIIGGSDLLAVEFCTLSSFYTGNIGQYWVSTLDTYSMLYC